MNILDTTVTKILTEPYFKYNSWFVDVEYECYGRIGTSNVWCKTEQSAKEIVVGSIIKV